MNDKVQKAYSLDANAQAVAIRSYGDSLRKLFDSYGTWENDDVYTEMTVLFVYRYCRLMGLDENRIDSYEKSSEAFNFANLCLGKNGNFFRTARLLLGEKLCENTDWLAEATRKMNCDLRLV